MGHSSIRIKVRRRKVAHLAAKSRQFTVNNINKSISSKVNKGIQPTNIKDAITCPFTGHKFVPTNPHPIPGKFGITIIGYDWTTPEVVLWTIPEEGFKQPKRLRKSEIPETGSFKQPKLKKMNRIEYMEKLTKYKLEKWIRKNPRPEDMFIEEVAKWEEERITAEERFRDSIISKYDKLQLSGRFELGENKYTEEKVAELKDINGDGHNVNDAPKDSPLIKKAQDITNKIHAKRNNLVCTNLKDHKRRKGRILLPEAKPQYKKAALKMPKGLKLNSLSGDWDVFSRVGHVHPF